MVYVQTELIKGNYHKVAWIEKKPYLTEGLEVVLDDNTTWTIKKMYNEIESDTMTPYDHFTYTLKGR